jgi:hypothetical protein
MHQTKFSLCPYKRERERERERGEEKKMKERIKIHVLLQKISDKPTLPSAWCMMTNRTKAYIYD